jgi:hypothetical protein
MEPETLRLRGKDIGEEELRIIQEVIAHPLKANRTCIARQVCARLGWNQTNGQLQERATREILRRLDQKGLIRLIPGQRGSPRPTFPRSWFPLDLPFPVCDVPDSITDIQSVTLKLVEEGRDVKTFAELMRRHHYLGSPGGVGRSVKYLFRIGNALIGGISWGSASWKVECRDKWIGWDAPTRIKNLGGIACNLRFLIIPRVKNLASHLLSRAVKQLPVDWRRLYGVELTLLETFVQKDKFRGTCYQAANWTYVGDTKGRGRGDRYNRVEEPVKGMWVKPLGPDFRERLCGKGEGR